MTSGVCFLALSLLLFRSRLIVGAILEFFILHIFVEEIIQAFEVNIGDDFPEFIHPDIETFQGSFVRIFFVVSLFRHNYIAWSK